ncbi:MAG: hypothetical protein KGQ49_07330 [Verrucomicrobia bacterium]|nr:hypothetical protein [Verrucomicrobiota bacterium]MBU6447193.1 hypothetical protein [Verrucomicrobiota bacterium]MDE3047501.1 hypothetical protein [Verrucomicrobiota bacterium]
MWARICEILLGIWLVASHFLFSLHHWLGILCAILIWAFALLSYIGPLNKMHLLQIIPAALLLYIGYTFPTMPLPLSIQNYILVALFLSMFAIIPSHASDHPRPWKRYLKNL